MKTMTIEELDEKTGRWLREAARQEQVIVTDHGRPLATVWRYPGPNQAAASGGFRNRVLLPQYEAIMNQPVGGTDSAEMISQDRGERL
jgi:antitoxin (DNA-binding transcriptional repressor) of toxin-antitoxin stability system